MRPALSWLCEIVFATCFGASFIAFAQVESPKAPTFPVPVKVLEIKDGDTISADLLLPWGVTLRGQDIRENSFDAWESSKRRHSAAAGEITDAEVVKGKLAAEAFRKLLSSGEVFVEPSRTEKAFGDRDVFGRVLAKIWVAKDGAWLDVSAEMKRRGHSR